MTANQATVNRAKYLAWLRTNYPDLYNEAMPQQGVSGFLDSIGSVFNNVVNNVTQALPQLANTYSQYRAQEQLIRMNSDRAKQGLPPLSYQNGQLVDASGQPYTSGDLSIAQTASKWGPIAIVGGVVLLAVLLLRGRRR
jgi:hypothetical protein